MSLCTVAVTGTPAGPCGTYPCSYTGGGWGNTATCCVASYSECGGSNTADCSTCTSPTTCCDYTVSGCTGTVSFNCLALGQQQCVVNPCCNWLSGPNECHKLDCSAIGPTDCASCGCTATGDCSSRSCADLGEGPCATCGCTLSGTCTPRTCAAVAAINNNPDVCAGCNQCGATWAIDDARGTLPWSVYTTQTSLAGSGSVGKTATNNLVLGWS